MEFNIGVGGKGEEKRKTTMMLKEMRRQWQ
jgi:hypothetical protein